MLRKLNSHLVIHACLLLVLAASLLPVARPARAAGTCGSGSWTSGTLEIHHINVGQADSALIVGPTGRSLLFDAGETNWLSSANAQTIGAYVEGVLGCKSLDYVVISHFHLDHVGYVGYGGLWDLVENQGFSVGTTLVRDYNNYLGDSSGTFTGWKSYLEGAGAAKLNPVTVQDGTTQVDLGTGVLFNIVAHDGNGALLPGDFHTDASPPSENDYSIAAMVSYGLFDELSAAPEAGDVDVYKVNHHGSAHSTSATFINQLDPEVSIVTVGDGNSYGHPAQSTMDALLATSAVYMTERGNTATDIGSAVVAGNIVIKTADGVGYTVNGTAYTATNPARADADGDGYFAGADPDDHSATVIPAPNGGCGSTYQTCSNTCQLEAGQVLINEVLPAPSSGPEWIELYNTTTSTLNLGFCYIDDIPAGSAAYQIPPSALIPSHGFWTLDRTSYFNNGGDDARLLAEDSSTVLDAFSYGSTGYDLSWYRFPDGEAWAASPSSSTTKGLSNNTPFAPVVVSISRVGPDPTQQSSVDFEVQFSKTVTGVDVDDFVLTVSGLSGAVVTVVTGSGAVYTVSVSTGSGNGTIRLDIPSGASISDTGETPLAGLPYTGGETYTVHRVCEVQGEIPLAECAALEAFYKAANGPGWTDHSGWLETETPCNWSGVTCTAGHVTELHLVGNHLVGLLSPQLGDLTELAWLDLSGNQLSGSIPPELGNLGQLTDLILANNHLSGSLPSEIGNLKALGSLQLFLNQFTGPIPPQLGSLTNLNYLYLNNNQLTGPIPAELGSLPHLTVLWLDNNQLYGFIPEELGSLSELESLTLHNNRLTGEFPSSLPQLTHLSYLTFDCWITSMDPDVIAFIDGVQPGWQDRACPSVISVTRVESSPTSASSVHFTVIFSEPVTGVAISQPFEDFSLTTSGITSAAVSGVSGSESTYTVTVDTGFGNGTLRLDVADSKSILNGKGNPLGGFGDGSFTGGEVYQVIKTPTFSDVPASYWSWSYVERLNTAGITGGCGGSNYCPETAVSRGQMAVFLERGMNSPSYLPPAATGTVFGDVPTSYWSASWVEKLFADGITGGCGGGNYCPDLAVSRAQMAVFLLRAKHGSSYTPPPATGVFPDVPTSYWAAPWIEQLYAEGITGGCGGGNYCPDNPVTRGQMAVFLVRTFSLP
jgi:hypothetical protein